MGAASRYGGEPFRWPIRTCGGLHQARGTAQSCRPVHDRPELARGNGEGLIKYPDVAHFQAGLTIQPGTVALVAKVTQGSTFLDPAYADFRAQAASIGAVFAGYHWLEHGNAAAQAGWCFSHNGTLPLMIDAEETSGASLTVSDITGFIDAYRGHGGIVHLLYLPRWYWRDHMGSPSLASVASRGMHLVASEYRAYSDSAWPAPYGGMTPEVWQYTDAQSYGGMSVDFNAYKGTIEQFAQMIGGDVATTDDVMAGVNTAIAQING